MVTSVVIPAHNEEQVLERTLDALRQDDPGFEIIVVCNGCTDRTAEVARSHGPSIRVFEIAEPSKTAAMALGDHMAQGFPRVHLDADVRITGDDLRILTEALTGNMLAVAPHRIIPADRSHVLVRMFYSTWQRLPQVRSGLFGRGVIVLSENGFDRISKLPHVMSDDLAVSDAFASHERRVVDDASVTVWPPRTLADLMRRRIRVVVGNRQAGSVGVRRPESATRPRDLVRLIREKPSSAASVAVFAAISLAARFAARRAIRTGDVGTWHRDNSSRLALSHHER